jgi:hypothetical protein
MRVAPWLALGPVAWAGYARGSELLARAGAALWRGPGGMTSLAMFPALSALARILGRARPGAIVDLHDADGAPGAGARVLAALPAMIAGLSTRGYAVVPLRDLL